MIRLTHLTTSALIALQVGTSAFATTYSSVEPGVGSSTARVLPDSPNSDSTPTEFSLNVGYSQSSDFWKTVQEIQSKSGNIQEIQSVLDNRYGQSETLFSTLRAQYSADHALWDEDFLHQAYFGSDAEALAGGEAANPVSPEITAYTNSVGILSAGLKSRFSRDGLRLSARGFGGFGPEKRIHVAGTELIDGLPVRTGTLLLAGGEIKAGHRVSLEGGFEIDGEASWRPTYFTSDVGPSNVRPDEKFQFWTHRWRLDSKWLKDFNDGLADQNQFGVVAILGQQPLPNADLLPISWDYQNRLKTWPGLAALAGTGILYRALSGDGSNELEIHAGIYGGHLGAMAQYRYRALELRAATYSLDNGLGLSGVNARIWSLGLGISL